MTISVLRPPDNEALAEIVHDLRLPLSHIKGFVTTLRRTDVEWDDATARDLLAEIDLQTDRLGALVELLLDSVRPNHSVANEPAQRSLTDPAWVVNGAVHRVSAALGTRTVLPKLPANLPPVRMNLSQMEPVMVNVIENAIKYSPAGTSIDVSARITPDRELEFCVQDHGPGVADEDRERIFQLFVRAISPDMSRVPGHGLRLAICRSIVRAHGGRLAVANTPGGGATFSILIPTDRPRGKGRSYPRRRMVPRRSG